MSFGAIRPFPFLLLVLVAGLAGATPARAQYDFIPPPTNGGNSEIDHFRRNSALLSAVSLTSIAYNSELVGPKPSPGWAGALGFFAGGFQVVLGAQKVSKDSLVASIDMFIGGAAIITSLSALSHAGGEPRASSVRAPGDGPQVAPLLGFNGALEPAAGVVLSF